MKTIKGKLCLRKDALEDSFEITMAENVPLFQYLSALFHMQNFIFVPFSYVSV